MKTTPTIYSKHNHLSLTNDYQYIYEGKVKNVNNDSKLSKSLPSSPVSLVSSSSPMKFSKLPVTNKSYTPHKYQYAMVITVIILGTILFPTVALIFLMNITR